MSPLIVVFGDNDIFAFLPEEQYHVCNVYTYTRKISYFYVFFDKDHCGSWFISFFWTVASVADIHADNPNGNKTLLANGVSTLFINGKPAVITRLRKF